MCCAYWCAIVTCSSVWQAFHFGTLQVIGMVPEEASLFKSALMPARFCFKTITNETYTVCVLCVCVCVHVCACMHTCVPHLFVHVTRCCILARVSVPVISVVMWSMCVCRWCSNWGTTFVRTSSSCRWSCSSIGYWGRRILTSNSLHTKFSPAPVNMVIQWKSLSLIITVHKELGLPFCWVVCVSISGLLKVWYVLAMCPSIETFASKRT